MRCGVCTWIFGERDLGRIADVVRHPGFDGVELLAETDRLKPADVRRIMASHGLDILSLTPADADPAHPHPATRASAIDEYRWMLDFAAEVETPILGFHGAVGRLRPITSQDLAFPRRRLEPSRDRPGARRIRRDLRPPGSEFELRQAVDEAWATLEWLREVEKD